MIKPTFAYFCFNVQVEQGCILNSSYPEGCAPPNGNRPAPPTVQMPGSETLNGLPGPQDTGFYLWAHGRSDWAAGRWEEADSNGQEQPFYTKSRQRFILLFYSDVFLDYGVRERDTCFKSHYHRRLFCLRLQVFFRCIQCLQKSSHLLKFLNVYTTNMLRFDVKNKTST